MVYRGEWVRFRGRYEINEGDRLFYQLVVWEAGGGEIVLLPKSEPGALLLGGGLLVREGGK